MICRIDGTGVLVGPPVPEGGGQNFVLPGPEPTLGGGLTHFHANLIYLISKDSVRSSERSHCVYIMMYKELKVKIPHYRPRQALRDSGG